MILLAVIGEEPCGPGKPGVTDSRRKCRRGLHFFECGGASRALLSGLRLGRGFGARLVGRPGDAEAQQEVTESFAQRIEQAHEYNSLPSGPVVPVLRGGQPHERWSCSFPGLISKIHSQDSFRGFDPPLWGGLFLMERIPRVPSAAADFTLGYFQCLPPGGARRLAC